MNQERLTDGRLEQLAHSGRDPGILDTRLMAREIIESRRILTAILNESGVFGFATTAQSMNVVSAFQRRRTMGHHECPIEPDDWTNGPNYDEGVACPVCEGPGEDSIGRGCRECDGTGFVPSPEYDPHDD